MAATCMAVCKGSRKKIRGIFISSCHLPVAVECDIVILSEPGPIPQAPVGQFCRHNLSPRGDGNGLRRIGRSSRVPRHNLSPRGDGNWESRCNDDGANRDTTYPREGTETRDPCRPLLSSSATQLIPARGRKLLGQRANSGHARHNLSPRGDGNYWRMPPAHRRATDTTYPREGTET